jgi:glutamine amidotransferase
MGWNDLEVDAGAPRWLLAYHGQCFYFVHSYRVQPADRGTIKARTDYGRGKFPSVIAADRLIGMQFHPELSGDVGESLLQDVLR